jgi:predicted nucleic acid-binding protein
MRRVISNTSCLIALSNIGRIEILHKLYGTVTITPEVRAEFGDALPDWFSIAAVADPLKIKLIQSTLDLGESSSIALAMESENSLLILDDKKARRFAKSMDLSLTGTLGVIVKAKQAGLIEENIATILEEFRRYGFHIQSEIEDELA